MTNAAQASPTAPDTQRRFDSGAWLVLAVALAWCLVTAFISAVGLSSPSDGFTITRNTTTGLTTLNLRFHALPTLLRTGDVVLAIAGQPISQTAMAPVGPNTRAGEVLVYTLERAGQRLQVPVTLAAPGPSGLLPGLWLRLREPRDFIVATLAFAVALWAFLARPGNWGARYLLLTFSYYFAVQWFGFYIGDLYQSALPLWLRILAGLESGGWFWFFFPSITLVAVSFPVVKWPLRRWPHLAPALLYGLSFLANLLNVTGAQAGLANSEAWGVVVLPILVGIILVTVITLAGAITHNWFTVREAVTRAQLRWVTLGLTLGLFVPFAWLLLSLLLSGGFPASEVLLWLPLFVPLSLAIAITRYRLFDIDVIIRRTLVYAVLSGLLALVYFGSVVIFENVLRGLTGSGSQIAIVLSTLIIAALFGPLRGRVQRLIDQRFYRRKYDAARTLAAFGARVRDDVDLEALGTRLTTVVNETMQPAQVGLWVRSAERRGTHDASG